MKQIIITLALVLMCSSAAFAAGSATGGSTKPETVQPVSTPAETPAPVPAPEPATTSNETDKKAADEAARKARLDKQGKEATKVVTATTKASDKKLCNDIEDMKKRIECRMTKTKAEIDYELSQVYMPEECRAIKNNDTWKTNCVERYKSLRPCWSKNFGEERIACVKNSLGLPEKLQTLEQFCVGKDDACREAYKKKVYNLVTFRFYDAEERVEEWYEEKKITLSDAVDFITFIAQSKIKFYQEAKTKADRLAIIDEVQKRWDAIVAKVKK